MRKLSAIALVILAPSEAVAQNLPEDALVFEELAGVRSSAMGGAHRGVGTSNDTVYLNPAGMSVARRYSVELNYAYSPFSELSDINVSAVDSKSGPVAGALAYTHTRGDGEGVDASLHRIYVGVSYPLTDKVAVGVTARHIRGDFLDGDTRRELELYGGDIGILANLGSVGLGITAHNVIKEDLERMMPLQVGIGASYNLGRLALAGDLVLDTRDELDTLHSYHVGAEYFVANAFPLRLGYYRAPFTDKWGRDDTENVLTAGAGWVSAQGAVAISAQRSFDRPRNWNLTASLQFFM